MANNWFVHPIRVRYQETDQMGVVFHGNYVTWFEIGRTEWIRNIGYSYADLESKGLLFPVIDLAVSYGLPAKYDDMVIVCTRMKEFTPLRMEFQSQVRRVSEQHFKAASFQSEEQLPGELLVHGGTKHVWVNEHFKPTRLSKLMPELYEKLTNLCKR
ncbi:4-hydroxybenzoyl-CoA thioesterase [Paenibacillus montaniterrae]|uniref:4-hydroxybenzoyl-CoA thioesterase n=1 Tax=Paenibacillus montaniterrae TaxID=429341 RepID=A0A919YPM3_9BACL|nr:thioesterase family protein [Paenibacillus montaniterrae]GIP17007.1 4-hydroxybenzoyl-CoA thioesterase [Paenibacillus montaniterrae]